MNHLTKNQLAFILDIKIEDARAKMCHAWEVENELSSVAHWDEEGKKIEDTYPELMPINMLANRLNLPTLQDAVNDIEIGYLNRPGTKKWILCDYPEKEIANQTKLGKKNISLRLPKVLREMISPEIQSRIKVEWKSRFPTTNVV